jgi:hypothetical protein
VRPVDDALEECEHVVLDLGCRSLVTLLGHEESYVLKGREGVGVVHPENPLLCVERAQVGVLGCLRVAGGQGAGSGGLREGRKGFRHLGGALEKSVGFVEVAQSAQCFSEFPADSEGEGVSFSEGVPA